MKFKSLIILLLLSTTVFSQDDESSFGIKAGYNLSSLKDSSVDSRNGFHVGFYGEHKISEHASFQPELLYSQLGFKDGANSTTKLDYIQIPLMFKGYVLKPLYIELGPQFSFNINKKEETNFLLGTQTETSTPNTFEWGINGGIGLSISPGFTIGLRYYSGLSEVYEETETFNKLYQVFVGVNF